MTFETVRQTCELVALFRQRGLILGRHAAHGNLCRVQGHLLHWSSRFFLGLLLFALTSCGHFGADAGDKTVDAAPTALPPVALKPAQRVQSEALTRLRKALDHGRLEEARALMASSPAPDPEAKLLEARASALEGHNTEAMRAIEAARKLAPADPTVYATAAEIYAGTNSKDTAWGELMRGEKLCGPSPDFLRARGILSISRTGGAEKGLALLEQALAADPEIPFIERALGQAHLLVAKERAKAKNSKEALEHVRASLTFDPDDVDARRLLAETLAGTGDFQGSAAVLQALVDKGERVDSELALTLKNAGFAALLAGDREEALADFASARKHGLSRQELSSAAEMLAHEAQRELDLGIEEYKKQDFAAAEHEFRKALEFDPDLIQAQNHLAVVLFKQHNFSEAVRLWQNVIATARAEKIELPEPVHLNLAKAQVQTGDRVGAELTLEEYLDRQPSGEWVTPTREMLATLSASEKQR